MVHKKNHAFERLYFHSYYTCLCGFSCRYKYVMMTHKKTCWEYKNVEND